VKDHELLASGSGQRLERWCGRFILRPESSAIWSWPTGKELPDWDGCYHGESASGGHWEWRNPLPDSSNVRYGDLSFLIKPTTSKHLGLFPEQSANWDWITEKLSLSTHTHFPKVLNLFGYTGGATLTAAAAGAAVTHVDASKAMVSWCSENARLSGLGDAQIRYLVEDSMTFLLREIRRGNHYDAVIMDPPSYGRGRGGELWKLSEHLPDLLESTMDILSEKPLFILLNTYSDELDAEAGALFKAITSRLSGSAETISLGLTGSMDAKFLPLGKAHRWTPQSA
jgi:23S rRNA (cytosine1962-C5)-methyltransferase